MKAGKAKVTSDLKLCGEESVKRLLDGKKCHQAGE